MYNIFFNISKYILNILFLITIVQLYFPPVTLLLKIRYKKNDHVLPTHQKALNFEYDSLIDRQIPSYLVHRSSLWLHKLLPLHLLLLLHHLLLPHHLLLLHHALLLHHLLLLHHTLLLLLMLHHHLLLLHIVSLHHLRLYHLRLYHLWLGNLHLDHQWLSRLRLYHLRLLWHLLLLSHGLLSHLLLQLLLHRRHTNHQNRLRLGRESLCHIGLQTTEHKRAQDFVELRDHVLLGLFIINVQVKPFVKLFRLK